MVYAIYDGNEFAWIQCSNGVAVWHTLLLIYGVLVAGYIVGINNGLRLGPWARLWKSQGTAATVES